MKLSEIPILGKKRNAWLLMAGVGTAAAMTLAPVVAGVAQAAQLKLTTFPTVTTTVATGATWNSPTNTTSTKMALEECPDSPYTKTVTTATWIWANLGQSSCTSTYGGPGSAPSGDVTLWRTFTVPGDVQGATLTLAADNGATVSINTHVVATLPSEVTTTNCDQVHHATGTFMGDLVTGTNTITIVATNHTYPGYNPAAVIAKLTVTSTLDSVDLCKHTGWRQWTTPTFSNQGDCVSYLVGNGNDPTIPNTASS